MGSLVSTIFWIRFSMGGGWLKNKSIGINIIIENPSWKIEYLDLNFNLLNDTYYPFRKDNNKINYINSKSNHPPTILRQIPKMVETRLSNNSSNKNLFNKI